MFKQYNKAHFAEIIYRRKKVATIFFKGFFDQFKTLWSSLIMHAIQTSMNKFMCFEKRKFLNFKFRLDRYDSVSIVRFQF